MGQSGGTVDGVYSEILLMKVGFTGTQIGMTGSQYVAFMDLIALLKPTEFHHGDCIGADSSAAKLVLSWFPECAVVCHPPKYATKRAFVGGTILCPAKSYMDRNRDIVDACDVLVACPRSDSEELRSGTWSTVRYARRVGKTIRFVFPDGRVV